MDTKYKAPTSGMSGEPIESAKKVKEKGHEIAARDGHVDGTVRMHVDKVHITFAIDADVTVSTRREEGADGTTILPLDSSSERTAKTVDKVGSFRHSKLE